MSHTSLFYRDNSVRQICMTSFRASLFASNAKWHTCDNRQVRDLCKRRKKTSPQAQDKNFFGDRHPRVCRREFARTSIQNNTSISIFLCNYRSLFKFHTRPIQVQDDICAFSKHISRWTDRSILCTCVPFDRTWTAVYEKNYSVPSANTLDWNTSALLHVPHRQTVKPRGIVQTLSHHIETASPITREIEPYSFSRWNKSRIRKCTEVPTSVRIFSS